MRLVALGFDPRRSDLPMRAAYPLLIANALAWASGHAAEGGASATAATGGSVLSRDGATEIPVTRVGFHSLGGEVLAGNLSDARESDTTPSPQLTLAGRPLAPPDPPAPRGRLPLSFLALLFATALAALEWVTFHRRWTS